MYYENQPQEQPESPQWMQMGDIGAVPPPPEAAPEVSDTPFEFRLAKAGGSVASRPKAPPRPKSIRAEGEGWLTVDVYQTPEDILIESAVAGVTPDDLDITATSDSVIIRGERKQSREVRDEDYLYQECYWGRFSRTVVLPQEVDPERATVTFKNGILVIRLPKVTRNQVKKLFVKAE